MVYIYNIIICALIYFNGMGERERESFYMFNLFFDVKIYIFVSYFEEIFRTCIYFYAYWNKIIIDRNRTREIIKAHRLFYLSCSNNYEYIGK